MDPAGWELTAPFLPGRAAAEPERAVSFTTLAALKEASVQRFLPVSRAYFGSEFCVELLPAEGELREVCRLTKNHGLALTLCTPPVTEGSLKGVLALLDILAKEDPTAEVVVNDWGVLHVLRRYPFTVAAGRTFQKNKRDPRILSLWSKLSPAMQSFYRGNNVLQPSFLAFLQRLRVSRVEIDLPPWGVAEELLRDSALPISLHVESTYVTTARACPTRAALIADSAVGEGGGRCLRPCVGTSFTLKNPAFAAPLRLQGNTYFIENEGAFNPELYAGTAVDRIVWHSPVPEGWA